MGKGVTTRRLSLLTTLKVILERLVNVNTNSQITIKVALELGSASVSGYCSVGKLLSWTFSVNGRKNSPKAHPGCVIPEILPSLLSLRWERVWRGKGSQRLEHSVSDLQHQPGELLLSPECLRISRDALAVRPPGC